MRRVSILAAAAIWLAASSATWGQSLLKGLEDRLQKAAGAVAQTVEAVPGTGYLGAVLDEDDQAKGGVRVKDVRAGAPADLGGLKAGDLITSIDAKAIARMEDLDAVLNKAVPGQRLRFMVERGGQRQTVNVMLGTRQSPPAAAPAAPPAPSTTPSEPITPAAPTPAPGAATEPSASAPPSLSSPSLSNPTSPPPAAPPALSLPDTSSTSPPATTPAAPSLTLPGSSPIRSRPSDSAVPPAEPAPPEARSIAPSFSSPSPAIGGMSGGASLGIMVDEPTDDARSTYGLTVRRGALITSVKPDSPAAQAGLPVGGLVVAFDGRRIDSADDLVGAIRSARAGQEVELGYYQAEKFNRKTVRLGSSSATSVAPPPAPFGPTSPLRAGPLGLGRPDRPLLGKVEKLVDSLAPKPASTVYNPSEMAALYESVSKLTEQVRKLEERLNAMENKASPSPIPPPAPAAGAFTPSNP